MVSIAQPEHIKSKNTASKTQQANINPITTFRTIFLMFSNTTPSPLKKALCLLGLLYNQVLYAVL